MDKTKIKSKPSLRGIFPAKDAEKLRAVMKLKNWNSTKCAVFFDTSKSVIESSLEGKSMNVTSIAKLQHTLKTYRIPKAKK